MSIKDWQLPVSWSPIFDWWVPLSWFVAPTDYSNPDPQQIDILWKGWLQCFLTISDRDSITQQRRSFWMIVSVYGDPITSDNWYYQLSNTNLWWVDNDINNNLNRTKVSITGSIEKYIFPFDQSDVVGNSVTITHNLNETWLWDDVKDGLWSYVTMSVQEISPNETVIDVSWFTPLVWIYELILKW